MLKAIHAQEDRVAALADAIWRGLAATSIDALGKRRHLAMEMLLNPVHQEAAA
jgi:hypothetical protein